MSNIASKLPRRRLMGLDTPTIVFVVVIILDVPGIGIASQSGEREGLALVAGALIVAAFFGIAYYALKSFPPRKG